jgi:hypothetical protein
MLVSSLPCPPFALPFSTLPTHGPSYPLLTSSPHTHTHTHLMSLFSDKQKQL